MVMKLTRRGSKICNRSSCMLFSSVIVQDCYCVFGGTCGLLHVHNALCRNDVLTEVKRGFKLLVHIILLSLSSNVRTLCTKELSQPRKKNRKKHHITVLLLYFHISLISLYHNLNLFFSSSLLHKTIIPISPSLLFDIPFSH